MKYIIFGCLLCVLGVAAWMHETPQERLLNQQNYIASEATETYQKQEIDWVNAVPVKKVVPELQTKKNLNSLVKFANETKVRKDSISENPESIIDEFQAND